MICSFPTAEAFGRIFPVGATRLDRYRGAVGIADGRPGPLGRPVLLVGS